MFARIERWINVADPQDTFWRSISKDNVTTWYGKTAESRIADPADPGARLHLADLRELRRQRQRHLYQYKPEDSTGVDLTQANERNRTRSTRSANRYLKTLFYGNRTPYFPDLTAASSGGAAVRLVLRAGLRLWRARSAVTRCPGYGQPWTCRLDPFSTYRSTFEVRTYRLAAAR